MVARDITEAAIGRTPTVTVSFFAATLSAWRAAHVAVPDLRADTLSLDAVVKLSIKTVPEARTADNLGAEREGTGVVIDDKGLILTIGYLILEAHSILVVTGDGRVFPAGVVGYDHATGFGLLRAGLDCRPVELGDSGELAELSTVLIAAHGAAGGGLARLRCREASLHGVVGVHDRGRYFYRTPALRAQRGGVARCGGAARWHRLALGE